jgi:capsular polysaccharide biosynthesis protein
LDIFDVVEAFRRQKWLLAGGLVLLVVIIVAAMFKVETGSLTPRLAPRYEATAEILVAPEGVEDLTNPDLTTEDLSDEASVYARLIATDRAATDIMQATGQTVLSLTASTGTRSPIIAVTVESPTAEGASQAAAAALPWLEQRLKSGVTVANIPADPNEETVVRPAASGQVTVLSEPTFEDADPNLWIEFVGPDGKGIASELNRLDSELSFTSDLGSNPRITVSVGPEVGTPNDTLTVLAPETTEDPRPPLEVVLRRGAVLFDIDGKPTLNPAAVSAEWAVVNPEVPKGVALILLDEEPAATQLGQRRGPIISAGALLAGLLLLMVMALMRDAWQTRARAAKSAPVLVMPTHQEEFEQPKPQPEPYLEPEEEEEEEEVASSPAEPSPWNWRARS